jgi:hypothetical protein
MPRSSSSSRSPAHSKVSSVLPARAAPPVPVASSIQPSHPPITQVPSVSIERPTLGQSMKEGFGVGVGMSVARNLMDRWFAPSAAQPQATPNPVPIMESSSMSLRGCNKELQALNACLATEKGEGVCSDVLRAYSHCQEMTVPPR